MNIALVTYNDNGAYSSIVKNEDDLLIDYLQTKGLFVEKAIWNDPSVNWEDYDLAIIKSPWDYFNLISDFYNWLTELEKNQVKVFNPIPTIRWNSDKHYLQDIKDAGLKVAECIFLKQGQTVDLNQYFTQLNVENLIAKPVVSGGSKNTFKINLGNVDQVNQQLNFLLVDEDFIIQPFLKEVEEDGEWSFLFFGGNFSHALLKKAKEGDFRVQHVFGGTVHPMQPSIEMITVAQQYVDRFAENCLYARVDGVIVNGEFLLMELELIEPYLFLDTNKESLANYYQALKSLLDN
ncbi:MAG: ATP-grasp domain-containing protein [Bacteroidia bacterium]